MAAQVRDREFFWLPVSRCVRRGPLLNGRVSERESLGLIEIVLGQRRIDQVLVVELDHILDHGTLLSAHGQPRQRDCDAAIGPEH